MSPANDTTPNCYNIVICLVKYFLNSKYYSLCWQDIIQNIHSYMISQTCLAQTNTYTLIVNPDEVPINRGIFTLQ